MHVHMKCASTALLIHCQFVTHYRGSAAESNFSLLVDEKSDMARQLVLAAKKSILSRTA